MQEPAKLVHFPFVIKVEGGASDKTLVPQNMGMEFLSLGTHSFGVAESRAEHLKTGSFKITAYSLLPNIRPGSLIFLGPNPHVVGLILTGLLIFSEAFSPWGC